MADPLSVSASIVALVQESKVTIRYLKGLNSAQGELRDLLVELINVRCLLLGLQDHLTELEPNSETFRFGLISLGGPNGPLKQFHAVLEELSSLLEPKLGWKKGIQMLGWHSKNFDAKILLNKVEHYKTLFTLALQSDLL